MQHQGNTVFLEQFLGGIQAATRQCNVLGKILGATNHAWLVPNWQAHGLSLVELRILKRRQPDELIGQRLGQFGLVEIDLIGQGRIQRDGQRTGQFP
ncbi:hypothetical protein D9M70_499290 [compost metagenome]